MRRDAAADVAVGLARLLGAVQPWRPRVARTMRRHGLTFGALVEIAAARRPHRVALVDDDGPATCAELLSLTNELADRLTGKGNRIAVVARNGRALVAAVAAAARHGSDVTLLDPQATAGDLATMIAAERVETVVTADVTTYSIADVSSTSRPAPRGHGRLVVLTSGTTGTPKGTHRTFRLRQAVPISTLVRRIPMPQGHPMLLTPPLWRGFGLGFLALGLTFGIPVVLSGCADAQVHARLLAEHRPALVVGVPPVLARLAEVVGRQLVGAVVSGAMPLDPAVAGRLATTFGPVVFNLYGATEQGWTTLATPADLVAAPGTVGRPAAGVRLRVLDAAGSAVPPGEVGQLWVDSVLAFSQYSNGSDKARAGRYVASGDLARCDESGRYYIYGRVVARRGEPAGT